MWWDKAWPLVEGCTRCSAGCRDCWALALERRTGRAVEGGGIKLRWDRIGERLATKTSRVHAVWNDLLHPDVPLEFIQAVYQRMRAIAGQREHTFVLLTKRAERLHVHELMCGPASLAETDGRNIILGVTCESNEYLWRVEELVRTHAAVRFVNAHLLGPLVIPDDVWGVCGYCAAPRYNSHFVPIGVFKSTCESCGHIEPWENGIDWLAIECNRPFRGAPAEWWGWCKALVEQAAAAGVPVWVKQGPLLTGRVTHNIEDFPPFAQRREFPTITQKEAESHG